MSYSLSMEEAKKGCKMADMQIDGNEVSNTSPVLAGSSEPGGAPMSGKHEFSQERTRRPDSPGQGSFRRKYP